MSSILTNNGAIVALQTLKNINSNLNKSQSEIATGKTINNAKDNSAIWALSKIMESDVTNLKAVGSGLSVAASTVATARGAVESVTTDLASISEKIVQAQAGIGTDALQAEIDGLVENIRTTIDGAQFQGVNLLKGLSSETVDYLSSLNRDGDGNVDPTYIQVTKKNLGSEGYEAAAVFTGTTGASTTADTFGTVVDAAATTAIAFDGAATGVSAGDKLSVTIGDKTASYTVTAEDLAATTPSDLIAVGMKKAIEALGVAGLTVDYDSGTASTLVLTNGGTNDLAVSGHYQNVGSGGLAALDGIDVTTAGGRTAALGAIKSLIDTITEKGAELGSVESQIEKQGNFLSTLTDSLTVGIGSMVDADMEEASARLQALQTQQQLGIQALSIANQAPSAILSLFR